MAAAAQLQEAQNLHVRAAHQAIKAANERIRVCFTGEQLRIEQARQIICNAQHRLEQVPYVLPFDWCAAAGCFCVREGASRFLKKILGK